MTEPHNFVFVGKSGEPNLEELSTGPISADCETDRGRILGVALSTSPDRGFYFPWDENKSFLLETLQNREVLAHNIKFDYKVLRANGIGVIPIGDPMIAAHLLEEKILDLKGLLNSYLGMKVQSFEDLVGKDGTLVGLPLETVGRYSAKHAIGTFALHNHLSPILKEKGLWGLYHNLEMPLVKILGEMEEVGIGVDEAELKALEIEYTEMVSFLEEALQYWAPGVNFRSHIQVGKLLFQDLGLPVQGRTEKTNVPSTREEDLESLRGHPVVNLLLTYREDRSILKTFIKGLLESSSSGRIHSSFSQVRIPTGRIASMKPNLENIPIRKTNRLREVFIPQEGSIFIDFDFEQIEPRVLAHLSQDPVMIKAFNDGRDIYAETATLVIGKTIIDSKDRFLGKQLFLSTPYGAGPALIAKMAGVSQREAREKMDRYFGQFRGAKTWIEKVRQEVRENGGVRTPGGRWRTLSGPEEEKDGVNTKVQGYSAELLKQGMINLDSKLKQKGLKARIVLTVYDEVLVEVPIEEKEEVIDLGREALTNFGLSVPIAVRVKEGESWGKLREIDQK